jgi:hypothetical protein
MSNKQKNQDAGNQLEKITRGFEKETPRPNEVPEKQQIPNEEVPNVGDHGKKGPTVPPNRNPAGENENEESEREESLSEILSQGKIEREEQQPEVQEAK